MLRRFGHKQLQNTTNTSRTSFWDRHDPPSSMIHIERLRLRVDLLYNWRIVNLMKCQEDQASCSLNCPIHVPTTSFRSRMYIIEQGNILLTPSKRTVVRSSCWLLRLLRAYLDSDRLRPVESPETFHLRARPTQRNPWCLEFVFFPLTRIETCLAAWYGSSNIHSIYAVTYKYPWFERSL